MKALLTCALLSAAVAAQAPGPDYLDPANAGPDYPIQGEYVGETAGLGGSGQVLAAQVIALGDGRFRAVLLPGGLPGVVGTGSGRVEVEGARSGAATSFSAFGSISGGDFQGSRDGKPFLLLKRERANPSLGTPPPAGAKVLFDGAGITGWSHARLAAPAPSGPKALEPDAEPGAITDASFGDYSLHIEFRTPFSPWNRGQNRGNSGLVLSTHAWGELQILDSFGLEPGLQDCGAWYEKAAPRVNACLPPLVWQVYEIQYRAPVYQGGTRLKEAVLNAWLNGIRIHADRDLAGMAARGPLILQYHFNPVWFRNVWILDGRADYPFPTTAPASTARGLNLSPRPRARGGWDAVAASLGWRRPYPGQE